MVQLNEERKKELFTWNEGALEELAKRKVQEDQDRKAKAEEEAKEKQRKEMMQKAWAEMAKRAEKENQAREAIMSYENKQQQKEKEKKDKAQQKAKAKRDRWEQEQAETNPVIALKLEAQKIQERVNADAAEQAANKRKLAEEQRRILLNKREEKRQKQEEEVQAVMDKMNKLREMHDAMLHSPTAVPVELRAMSQESMKAFEDNE